MKKVFGKLLLFITSIMCVIVLFGCSSINSRAAEKIHKVTELKLDGENLHFKTVSEGYYFVIRDVVDKHGVKHQLPSNKLGKINANEVIDDYNQFAFIGYDFLGEVHVYVIAGIKDMQNYHADIDKYKNDPDYSVTEYTTTLTRRMPKPEEVKASIVHENGYSYWTISWKNDGFAHITESKNKSSINQMQTLMKGTNNVRFPLDQTEVSVRTITTDLNTVANSEPVLVNIPDEDAGENESDDPGTEEPSEPENPSDPSTPTENETPAQQPSTPAGNESGAQQSATVQTPEATASAEVAADNSEKIDSSLKTTKFTKINSANKKVTLTWKKQTKDINGYVIQYSTDKSFASDVKTVNINKSKTNSKIIKKLKAKTKYYFRIRTFKTSGSEKVYSKWSKVKNIKIK
ncbi:fibronectin type III domain-containing protein [Butyrivibrio sp. VCD2006]|uniref:fibronectin type III domain-containing protein n=1 Tax=Butyrivibrio sp. VCD2006 TaxID=1280664 RepID=UPI0004125E3F|nr:fibronectin type III domain-containing protein [Butyrivibrio sp. VCD2006]